ncbi:MAG: ribosome maturation factor RimM [Clostridiales bacterium]|nr:ribosome maturation factor RimM [Clostridiales bacterium]
MIKEYLELGQIVSTHGVRGEMRFNPWCDSPEFVKKFKTVYMKPDGKEAVRVLSARPHGNIVLLTLEGVDTVEKARDLKDTVIYMKRSDAKLPKGSWFVQELLDCIVIDADEGHTYGILKDVSKTGANDVWHIDTGKKTVLIPAVKEFVIDTDVENGVIKIRPIKGFFDDED